MIDDMPSLSVIASARAKGLAPSTIQGIGGLLRSLVSMAHRLRWAAPGLNPMADVEYLLADTADRDAGPGYVPVDQRPSTAMVEDLIAAMGDVGGKKKMLAAGDLGRAAAYPGLRLGEQVALDTISHRAGRCQLIVSQAVSWPAGLGATFHAPKNGRPRTILLPGSLNDVLAERVGLLQLIARKRGHTGRILLFPRSLDALDVPMSESAPRRLFIAAARTAGWDFDGDHPVLPYRNLRHHAATWMHDVAGMPWVDVSRALGHHSVAFTLSRYVLPSADADERNRRRLEDL